MPFTYAPKVAGANFEPIALEVRKEGELLASLGVTVSVLVKDSETKAVIVDNAIATSPAVGRWEYFFTPEQVRCICSNTMWLVQWQIVLGDYTHITESALLPVRKPI